MRLSYAVIHSFLRTLVVFACLQLWSSEAKAELIWNCRDTTCLIAADCVGIVHGIVGGQQRHHPDSNAINTKNITAGTNTQLGQVIRSFDNVLHHGEIHAKELLDACQTYAEVLKKTGPKAVERDFTKNLSKARALYQTTFEQHTRLHHKKQTITLEAMLETERNSGIHNGSKLHDPSGAMGLLWIRRSIAFQAEMYQYLLDGASQPGASSLPKRAALHAYKKELQPHHGWTLRKFYNAFLSTKMPKCASEMLLKLGGDDSHQYANKNGSVHGSMRQEQDTIADLKRLISVWKPLIDQWKKTFDKFDMEDESRA